MYWMSRDQRVFDNWALLYARELAVRFNTYLIVVFCLAPRFLGATRRQYEFMIAGLEEVDSDLGKLNIPFRVITGNPPLKLAQFIGENSIGAVVTDFSPLRIRREWNIGLFERIDIPLFEVDAHNIVPCRETSQKQEYGAYTIRPKINTKLGEFLVDFPSIRKQPSGYGMDCRPVNWEKIRKSTTVSKSVGPADGPKPGGRNGLKTMRKFLRTRIAVYNEGRNDPNLRAQSGLSPYLHFGQISAQRVALEAVKLRSNLKSVKSFLEELIVRRELSDNFCLYNQDYDSTNCFPEWALRTLDEHRKDRRDFIYSPDVLEKGKTHDSLWNSAQMEMVISGGMNGYLRMYWAKKILEWSPSPEEALVTAIRLNDKYQLDGRDPNGYTGIAWSIGGVHDRPWKDRPVNGKIRYMNESGCRRKFDVDKYVQSISNLMERS